MIIDEFKDELGKTTKYVYQDSTGMRYVVIAIEPGDLVAWNEERLGSDYVLNPDERVGVALQSNRAHVGSVRVLWSGGREGIPNPIYLKKVEPLP